MLIQTQHGTRTEQQVATDDALLAAYRDHFGIALSRVPDDPAAAISLLPVYDVVYEADQYLPRRRPG